MGSAINQGAGGCQCGVTCSNCPACPGVNLCRSLSVGWSNINTGGGGSGLTNVGGGCTWQSGCATPTLALALDLTGPTPILQITIYPGTCPGGTPTAVCSLPADSVQCSPLALSWTITSTNCPAAFTRGYRTFTVTP
jgi:hypothetical protein